MPNEDIELATCRACGRSFWASTTYTDAVRRGVVESLCDYCDNSHDDGEAED
jgi:uncharacterized protein with PIN domain